MWKSRPRIDVGFYLAAAISAMCQRPSTSNANGVPQTLSRGPTGWKRDKGLQEVQNKGKASLFGLTEFFCQSQEPGKNWAPGTVTKLGPGFCTFLPLFLPKLSQNEL